MRVFLSVDMEGVAGVVHEDQTNPIDPRCAGEYARFRRLMTQEANAAIDGAFAGGATTVLVNDSHWTMRNLLAEELDPRRRAALGWTQDLVDDGRDRTRLGPRRIRRLPRPGRHPERDPRPHLHHSILDVRLNGASVGELGLNAALAGAFGVPVALVSGDQALAAEARALLGEGVRTVVVKEAISRHAAVSVAPVVARERIRAAMCEAVAGAGRLTPLVLPRPVSVEVDWALTVQADQAAMAPGFERRGPRTVGFTHQDYREVFRSFRTMFNLAAG